MTSVTTTQKLADLELRRQADESLETFVVSRRSVGLSWQVIADEIRSVTGGSVDLHRETLRVWAANGFGRASCVNGEAGGRSC